MLQLGLGIFLIYTLVTLTDELYFHRRRVLSKREAWGHLLNTFLLIVCTGMVVFLEYGDNSMLYFGVAALASVVFLVKDEHLHARECGGGEQMTHALQFVLHPLLLLIIGAMWPFIDGVSLFVGVVLPFSTDGLRLLMTAYLVLLGLIFGFQLSVHKRRTAGTPPPTPTPAPVESETPSVAPPPNDPVSDFSGTSGEAEPTEADSPK